MTEVNLHRGDYIEKVFNYVQNEINFGITQDQSALGTLRSKWGMCYGSMNLMSALCRRQGFKTRFKFVPIIIDNKVVDFIGMNMDNNSKNLLLRVVNNFIPHAILGVNVNDEWIEADPVIPCNLCGYLKYPINKFGDRSVWLEKDSKYVVYLSEIPSLYINILDSLGNKRIGKYINETSKEGMEIGKKFIENCGGKEEYNKFLMTRYINV